MDRFNPAVIMTTRVPVGGDCKSRMGCAFSSEERNELQRAMLLDGLNAASGTGYPIFVFYTPDDLGFEMAALARAEHTLAPQVGHTLGVRMEHAFEQVVSQGYSPCVLIGSDVPQLTTSSIEKAFIALENADSALTPTEDGGYCLIGLKQPTHAAFPAIKYGTENVLEQTRSSLEDAGFSCSLLEPCLDIDTPFDLADFLETATEHDCPNTYDFAVRHTQQLNAYRQPKQQKDFFGFYSHKTC